METLRIDILNPKARELLQGLADLNLIRITEDKSGKEFEMVLKKLRAEAEDKISLDEITAEVEAVREQHHGN